MNTYDFKWQANWMADLPEIVKDKQITTIPMPGSHDSSAYTIADGCHRLPGSWNLIGMASCIPFIKNTPIAWTLCHDKNLYEQMCAGIRALDFRIVYNGTDFYLAHTLYTVPLHDALQQVADFLNKHNKEMILIRIVPDWANRTTITPDIEKLFFDRFYTEIGHLLVEWDDDITLSDLTYRSLLTKNKRVLVFWQGVNIPRFFWNISLFNFPWDNTSNVTTRIANIKKQVSSDNKYHVNGLWYTLVPQTDDIINGLLCPCRHYSSKKEMASALNATFQTVIDSVKHNLVNYGPIFCDYPTQQMIDTIIYLNPLK